MQCWEISAKYALEGSSSIAVARRRRAAEMRVGEDLWVLFEGIIFPLKTPSGGGILTKGSAWMYIL